MIIFLIPQMYPEYIGGAEIFNFYLLKNLKINESVIISNTKEKIADVKNFHLIGNKYIQYMSIILYLLLICTTNYKRKKIIYLPYGSNTSLIYPVLLVNFLFNVKYVFTIHGGGLYKWRRIFFHERFFKKSSRIIAVSEEIKIEYEKRTNKKIEVIPPLIPFDSVSKNILIEEKYFLKDKKIILYVGSLKIIKRPMLLLKSFNKLGIDYIIKNNLLLIIVGDGPNKIDCMNFVENNNLKEHVIIEGIVDRKNISKYYACADIYVITSKFEGTPLSLLEAMYNELAIIGSDVRGINNILVNNKNGLLFHNDNDLISCIRKIVDKPEFGYKLGKNAKKYMYLNYSYIDVVNKYSNILK